MAKVRILLLILAGIILASITVWSFWPHTTWNIRNFSDAKRVLEEEVYYDHRVTIYCDAPFDGQKSISLPDGFQTKIYVDRAKRVEWEHAVPAEHFGQTFTEWREGSPECVRNSKPYKGRRCAEKASAEYRKMDTDLYNLFPAIGALNAARKNYDYGLIPGAESNFGSCEAKYGNGRFEPPARARGQVARASLYMADAYPRFRLSDQQRKLFEAWNRLYPVDQWECTRAKRIEKIQGNPNRFVREPCEAAGLWPWF